jgi:hypothetical protein
MSYVFTISSNMPTWLVYVTIAIGLVSCFLGYKLLRIWMALIGFVIGMAIGYFASYKYFSNMVIPIIIGFLAGVIIGFIAYRIYLFGVFLIALVTTLGFFGQLLAHYNEPGWVWILLTAILAIVAAIIATKFVKPVIIISTALNGATTVMMGIFKLLQIDAKHILLIAALLLAILGIMVQFFTNKNSENKK